jgi:hypothetical protein
MPSMPLTDVFADLPDPRRETANKLHRLTDILVIATCAMIGGAESWEAIAEYGRTKESFFRCFLPLENGIPSPDIFERVLAKLAPGVFSHAFGRWMATVEPPPKERPETRVIGNDPAFRNTRRTHEPRPVRLR